MELSHFFVRVRGIICDMEGLFDWFKNIAKQLGFGKEEVLPTVEREIPGPLGKTPVPEGQPVSDFEKQLKARMEAGHYGMPNIEPPPTKSPEEVMMRTAIAESSARYASALEKAGAVRAEFTGLEQDMRTAARIEINEALALKRAQDAKLIDKKNKDKDKDKDRDSDKGKDEKPPAPPRPTKEQLAPWQGKDHGPSGFGDLGDLIVPHPAQNVKKSAPIDKLPPGSSWGKAPIRR